VYQNWFFWVLIFGGVAYAFFRWFHDPKNFTWYEIPIQIGASTLVLWLLCSLFFFYGSDVYDQEIWNGHVSYAEYREPYDYDQSHQHCFGSGKTKTCWTTYTCETAGAGYGQYDSLEESAGISVNLYDTYRRLWGNQEHAGASGNHCAGHEGNIWRTYYRGPIEVMVPVSSEREYVNYLKASEAIRRKDGAVDKFRPLLAEYPRMHSGSFGNMVLDRVIVAGFDHRVEADKIRLREWQADLDGRLSRELGILGAEKGVNILVYLVDTPEQEFSKALGAHWSQGKKNDVIIVIGAPSFPESTWVEVMAWTHVEEFKTELARRIREMPTITSAADLVAIITSQVSKNATDGGYEGMEMEELQYLASDVKIAWWAQIVIFLIYAAITYAVSWALANNDLQNLMARGTDLFARLKKK